MITLIFYGAEIHKMHDVAPVNINYDKNSWNSTTHGSDKSDTNPDLGSCYLISVCIKCS